MKTRAEFPRGGTLWCWSFFPKCIDMSGISTCPRDETDLGCIFAQLVPPEYGEGRMQEAASWDTPLQCPKFSRAVWGGTGPDCGVQEFHLVKQSAWQELAWEQGALQWPWEDAVPGLICPACCLLAGLFRVNSGLSALPGIVCQLDTNLAPKLDSKHES